MNDSGLALLGRARIYCASAEQCVWSVRQKLGAWGATPEEAAIIIERLVDEGYLDERRYARAYCESKMLRGGWGRMKVVYQLRAKRLPNEVIDEAVAAVDDEAYMGLLHEAAAKKWSSLHDADAAVRRRKTAAFLAQRGYTMDEISQTLKNIKL